MDAAIAQMVAFTDTTPDRARQYLQVTDGDVEQAVSLFFESGGGSALLDMQPKLEKILRGMNTLSGEIPIQVKIRTGVKDNQPTAAKLAERLIMGG